MVPVSFHHAGSRMCRRPRALSCASEQSHIEISTRKPATGVRRKDSDYVIAVRHGQSRPPSPGRPTHSISRRFLVRLQGAVSLFRSDTPQGTRAQARSRIAVSSVSTASCKAGTSQMIPEICDSRGSRWSDRATTTSNLPQHRTVKNACTSEVCNQIRLSEPATSEFCYQGPPRAISIPSAGASDPPMTPAAARGAASRHPSITGRQTVFFPRQPFRSPV